MTRSPIRPTTMPMTTTQGTARSMTFQNDRPSDRILGTPASTAPAMPPRSEMPPFQTAKISSGLGKSPGWLIT